MFIGKKIASDDIDSDTKSEIDTIAAQLIKVWDVRYDSKVN